MAHLMHYIKCSEKKSLKRQHKKKLSSKVNKKIGFFKKNYRCDPEGHQCPKGNN